MDKFKLLEKKIDILRRGILPPLLNNKPLKNFAAIGVGAGPQGKTFIILDENYKETGKMISTPIFPAEHHLSSYAIKTEFGDIPGTIRTENGIILKSNLPPKFLNKRISDGSLILTEGFAMMHSYGTCVSALGYSCKHFDNSEECQYCEIEPVGLNELKLPAKPNIKRLAEALIIAVKEDNIRSITFTSGTFESPEEVVKNYIEVLKIIKSEVNITVHVQHEPIKDKNLMKELSLYADSVGNFLEIFNEEKRKEICPGKSNITKEEYMTTWREEVKLYGKGNIMTTCILGFGVDYREILKNIEIFAEIGVKTTLLFVRSKSQRLKNYIPTYLNKPISELVDLFIETAKILKKYNLCFKVNNGSGCLGCQGCSATIEACELV